MGYQPMAEIKNEKTRAWIHGRAKRLAGAIGDRMVPEGSRERYTGLRFDAAAREISEEGTGPGRADRAFRAADWLAMAAGESFYITGGDRNRYIIGDHCYLGGREIEALIIATASLLRHYTKARDILKPAA